MARTLVLSTTPNTSKLIVAICPDPLTPVNPGRLKSTRIFSAFMNVHIYIGAAVPDMFPALTPVTFTTLESKKRSNCAQSRSVTFPISIVTSNAPDTTGGALTVTGTPMVTASSSQIAGTSSPPVSTISPFDISTTHESPCDPVISNPTLATHPDPLTASSPESSKITLIVFASMKRQSTIGIVVPSMFPAVTSVTFTTPGSNDRSNTPPFMQTTSSISIVALNTPNTIDTTSGALTLTGTPTVTSESFQTAGISSATVSVSFPFDISRTLVSPCDPVTSKLIVAIRPEPRNPVAPWGLNTTVIVSAPMNSHESIGTCSSLMRPSLTSVTFTTPGSNVRSNCPQSRSTTLWMSITTSNVPDTTSGALTQTRAIVDSGAK